MTVPLLDLKPQFAPLKAEIMAAIEGVCDSQMFILGPNVTALEKACAEYCQSAHGIGVSSGTDALLLALMDQRGVARATLIGNSLGGRIAWTFAAKHPERTDKLVLISPDGFASPGFEYGKAPDVPMALQAMQYVLPKALLEMNLEPSYGDPSVLTPATVDRYHDLMLAPGARKALLGRMEQTVLVEPEPLLRSIKAPVLLLWGEKDALIPFSNAADYTRNLSDSRLVSFPALGHVPHEEAPVESLAPLRAFLAELS